MGTSRRAAPMEPYGLLSYPKQKGYGSTMNILSGNQAMPNAPTAPGGGGFNADPYIYGGLAVSSLLAPMLGKKSRAGQTFSSIASGAATGASIGSIVPGVGTAIGAGVGGVIGGLSGALSESPEEQRNAKMDELRKSFEKAKADLETKKQEAMSELATSMGKYTGGLQKRYGESAASRMAAAGRTGAAQVEAAQLPIVEQIAGQGSEALQKGMTSLTAHYDQLLSRMDADLLEAEKQFRLGGEIPAGIPDYLAALAPSAVKFAQNERYGGIMSQLGNQQPNFGGN